MRTREFQIGAKTSIASVVFIAVAARFGSKLAGFTRGEYVGLSARNKPNKVGRIRDPWRLCADRLGLLFLAVSR
jgi:hypothetical protein